MSPGEGSAGQAWPAAQWGSPAALPAGCCAVLPPGLPSRSSALGLSWASFLVSPGSLLGVPGQVSFWDSAVHLRSPVPGGRPPWWPQVGTPSLPAAGKLGWLSAPPPPSPCCVPRGPSSTAATALSSGSTSHPRLAFWGPGGGHAHLHLHFLQIHKVP